MLKRSIKFLTTALFIALPLVISAGDTGKITGTVIDKENGNVLPGVNVLLEGTSMGAATSPNGEFFILFVQPGLYNVKFSYIGYAEITMKDVRVTKDLTTNLYNIELEPEAIEGQEVIVIAEKPLIEINATNEVRVIRSEDIQNMPLRGYNSIASLQTGVVSTGGDLHVRGGRTDEVGYYIDGVYVNNPYSSIGASGTSSGGIAATPARGTMEVPNTALEEISFQAGGFNAEYGSANSGIISATTKEGREKLQASFESLTDAGLPTSGDPSAFSYGYNLLSGSVSGPVPGINAIRYSFAGEFKNLDDANSSWGTHPVYTGDLDQTTGLPANGEEFTDANGNGVWDDKNYWVDDGTVYSNPKIGPLQEEAEEYVDANGNGKYDAFHVSGDDIEYQNGPLPNNGSTRSMLNGNVVVNFKDLIGLPLKLKTGGSFFSEERSSYIHSFSLFNYYNDNGSLKLRFPKNESSTSTLYARLTGALAKNTYLSFQVSKFSDQYEEYDPLFGEGNGKFLFDDGSESDIYPFLQYGKRYDYAAESWVTPLLPTAGTRPGLADSVAQFAFAGRVWDDYTKQDMSHLGITGSITKQMGRHEIKAGIDHRKYTIRYYRILAPMRLASTLQQTAPYSAAQKDSLIGTSWDTDENDAISSEEYDTYYDKSIFDAYMNAYADNIGYDLTGQKKLDSGLDGARNPLISAVYIQDKLELKDLILNLGLRYDRIDPDNKRFNPETGGALNIIIDSKTGQLAETVYLDDTNENGEADSDDKYRSLTPTAYDATGKPLQIKSEVRTLLSPRVGMAFPVTDKTVFHAQYGKFIQQPELNRMFISYTRFLANMQQGNYTTSGNPDLQPVITTQYELGFKQLITNDISVDATVFYKQMSGYVTIRNVTDVTGAAYPLNYAVYVNGDYGTVKGLSFAFGMRRINNVQVNANYTLSYAGGTGSNSTRQYTIAWQSGNSPTFVSPLEFDQRHTGNITIDYRTGDHSGLLSNFGVNILAEFGSGTRFTPSHIRSEVFQTSDPSRPIAGLNTGVMPANFNVGLQIDKGFNLMGTRLNVYLQVENVFNSEIVKDVYAATGEPGNDNWLSTAEGKAVWLDKYGESIGADLYNAKISHPYNWGAPRQIRFGLRINL
ncbi:MAG: TonB-dependent receptor domain-containing protein [Fidelibacterota bacterium]